MNVGKNFMCFILQQHLGLLSQEMYLYITSLCFICTKASNVILVLSND